MAVENVSVGVKGVGPMEKGPSDGGMSLTVAHASDIGKCPLMCCSGSAVESASALRRLSGQKS